MSWPGAPAFEVEAALGVDVGALYDDAVGLQLGLVYHPLREQ
jgi:tetrahydromethanopterin S-methyltransferase subunit G